MKYLLASFLVLGSFCAASAQEDVPFTTTRVDTLLIAQSARAGAVLPSGTTVHVIGNPRLSGNRVFVSVKEGLAGWVPVGSLTLSMRDDELAGSDAALRVSHMPAGPTLVRIDTLLVAAPGEHTLRIATTPRFAIGVVRLNQIGTHRLTSLIRIRNFRDGDNWMLDDSIEVAFSDTGPALTVPKGFVTRFATVPSALRSVIGPTGPYSIAAVVHEYMYWTQSCSRHEADNVFRATMKDSDASARAVWAMYVALRVSGDSVWKSNHAERDSGMVRILPPPFDEIPDSASWGAYRAALHDKGVFDRPQADIPPTVCFLGSGP